MHNQTINLKQVTNLWLSEDNEERERELTVIM